ncbi:SprT-like domain-containing protein [Chryseobacterium polytrichastri]|uniref:Uncharacterized protein n=1 Tax=Chryseobacterium polytrichastri TaxID=1302687 RepID=A0A1M7DP46_9FLAO|nr:SprT-like domain-containing protein [Chryseobacterium polytrichastri]SHL81266.1 hypothetical protein SAMN05444267_102558 [Chryseobacterium polytrichastri]
MKKNFYYKTMLGLFSLSFLTLFTLSCKKDQQNKVTKTENVTVQEAKAWMLINRPDIDLGENWNNTKQINLENANGILKVRINESLTNGTWALRDIMFQKDDHGKVDAVVYKIFVDTSYFTNKKGANNPLTDKRNFINNNDFTGKMVLYTIQNQIIKIRQYENGAAIEELVRKVSSKPNPYNPISYIKEDKPIMVCNNIGEECHPIGGGSGPLPGIPLPEFNITVPKTPTVPPILFPPDSHTNPSTGPGVPIGNPGGGGSAGTPSVSRDINNKIKDPCLSKTFEKAKNANFTNTVEDIIKKLDGNKKVQISVSDQDVVQDSKGNYVEGKTTDYLIDPVTGNFSCSILLNSAILSRSTQEYAVGTIVHEVVHAYLQYTAGNTNNHLTNHETMSKEYVKPITDFLTSTFPTLSPKDATAIAWGGLEKTPYWNDSYKNDSFSYGDNGGTMTFNEMKGLENAHRFGTADNSTSACGNKQ